MRLAEWDEDDGFHRRLLEFVEARVADVGTQEVASVIATREPSAPSRALVATEIGLLDCGYQVAEDAAPTFTVKLSSWDTVPAPSVTWTTHVAPGWSAGPSTLEVRIALDPPFIVTARPRQHPALLEFVTALLRLRSPGET
jgi:hypothetical protein